MHLKMKHTQQNWIMRFPQEQEVGKSMYNQNPNKQLLFCSFAGETLIHSLELQELYVVMTYPP